MIEVSGVRSSCDTVETKSALARSSAFSCSTTSRLRASTFACIKPCAASAARCWMIPVSTAVQERGWSAIATQGRPNAVLLSPIGVSTDAETPASIAALLIICAPGAGR